MQHRCVDSGWSANVTGPNDYQCRFEGKKINLNLGDGAVFVKTPALSSADGLEFEHV